MEAPFAFYCWEPQSESPPHPRTKSNGCPRLTATVREAIECHPALALSSGSLESTRLGSTTATAATCPIDEGQTSNREIEKKWISIRVLSIKLKRSKISNHRGVESFC